MGLEKASTVSVDDVRSTYSLQVPEFQRGFAWGPDQWKDLWQDAFNVAGRSDGDHYTGTLMFRQLDPAMPHDVEIVDGQQRLTSIALLLKALGAEPIPIKFRNNEPIQNYFDYFAQSNYHLAPQLAQNRSFYGRNIQKAAEYFSCQTAKLDDEMRGRIVDALRHRFKLFVLTIQPKFDVHVAFETINNRGKPLSILEKLKNRLIYIASISADSDGGGVASQEVHRCWKGIYTWLGRGSTLLADDEFLRAHSMGWFRHDNEAAWLTTQLFDEAFPAVQDSASPQAIIEYVRSLENAAVWWHYLNEPDLLPIQAQGQLASLDRTAFASARSMLLWALVRLAESDSRLVVQPAYREDWISTFVDLAKQAERFAVLVLMGNERRSNTGQGDLNRNAYALAHPGEPLFQVGSEIPIPPLEARESVRFARDYVKSLVDNWTLEQPEYEPRADARFPWNGYFEPQKLASATADRTRRGSGFYNWQFGKLAIYEWELWLRGSTGLPEKMSWEKFSWDASVEHIYPQNPVAGWEDSVSVDGRSASLRSAVLNSLGNLLLLSTSRNAALSNHLYSGSVDVSHDKIERFRGGSYSEWQVAQVCKDWSVAAIAARGIAVMRHAQKHWNFEVVPKQAKLTEWLPILFGEQADRIQGGDASHGRLVDGRALAPLLEKFETVRPR